MNSDAISRLMTKSLQYNYSTDTGYSTWLDIANCFLEESVESLTCNNYEKAYVDLTRFIDLILNKLPNHPEFYPNPQYEHFKSTEIPEALSSSGKILSTIINRPTSPILSVNSTTLDVTDSTDLMTIINEPNWSSVPHRSREIQIHSSHSLLEEDDDITFASPLTPERTSFALTNQFDHSLYDYKQTSSPPNKRRHSNRHSYHFDRELFLNSSSTSLQQKHVRNCSVDMLPRHSEPLDIQTQHSNSEPPPELRKWFYLYFC